MQAMDAILENQLLSRWGALLPRAPSQPGGVHDSDAELVPLGDGRFLALTIDTIAEEVMVGLYREAETAGWMAAVSALSDLAAVGADPIGLLLSVGLPSESRETVQEGVARGVSSVCRQAGVFVLGGDTNDASVLAISAVGAGTVPVEGVLTRRGARADDVVYVTGRLGTGAALAASQLLLRPGEREAGFCEQEYRPYPRLAVGRLARGLASACMDTSDGLIATLDQLARLNGLGIVVERPAEELLDDRVDRTRRLLGLPALSLLAAHHGEFELVLAVPPPRAVEFERAVANLGETMHRLGRFVAEPGVRFGDRTLDTARIRNLAFSWGGDPAMYARHLLELVG